jgi:hypothetical protein
MKERTFVMTDYAPFVGPLDDAEYPEEAEIFYLDADTPLCQVGNESERMLRYHMTLHQPESGGIYLDFDQDLFAQTCIPSHEVRGSNITIATFAAYDLRGRTVRDGRNAGEMLAHGAWAEDYEELAAAGARIGIYTVTFRGPKHGAIQNAATEAAALAQHGQAVMETAQALAQSSTERR